MKFLIYCFIFILSLYSLNSFGQALWKKDCYQILENHIQDKSLKATEGWIDAHILHDHTTLWGSYLDCIKRKKKFIESEITSIENHLQNLDKNLQNPEEQAEIHEIVMPVQNEEAESKVQSKGYLCNPRGRYPRLYYDMRCSPTKAIMQ